MTFEKAGKDELALHMFDAQGNSNRFDFKAPQVNTKAPLGEFGIQAPAGHPDHQVLTEVEQVPTGAPQPGAAADTISVRTLLTEHGVSCARWTVPIRAIVRIEGDDAAR